MAHDFTVAVRGRVLSRGSLFCDVVERRLFLKEAVEKNFSVIIDLCGRQKIRWSDCLSKDLKERKLKEEDAIDRERWRKKIKMPDPQISFS